MQRIVEVERLQSSVSCSWTSTWSPRICAQVSIEKHKNKRLASLINQLEINEGIKDNYDNCHNYLHNYNYSGECSYRWQ